MKLNPELEGRTVRIVDVDGQIFEGVVGDYIFPEDNDPEGVPGIVLENCPQRPGELIGFNEPEVQSVTSLD